MKRSLKAFAAVALGGVLAAPAFPVSTLPGTYSLPLSFVVPMSNIFQPAGSFSVPAPVTPARRDRNPSSASPEEARFVALVNRERARRGIAPLAWENSLCIAGRRHSREMARMRYFDHISPTPGYETPADRWERVADRLPDEYTIGENLFHGSIADVAWGHSSLMESDPHRENLLNPAYRRIGVGVYVDGSGGMWVTQLFRS